MWRDILTIVGFGFTIISLALALFAWLQITPQNLKTLTKDRLISNKLLWPIITTIFCTTFLVLYIVVNVTAWWLYLELAWIIVYTWLIWISFNRKAKSSIFGILLSYAPAMYLITNIARLNNAINIYVVSGSFPKVQVWTALGLITLYLLLIGMNLGVSIRYKRTSNLFKELEDKCSRCEVLQNKAEEAIGLAEKIITEHNKDDKT